VCRNIFASLLIDSGANPKAIQQFMGHSKIQNDLRRLWSSASRRPWRGSQAHGCLSAWQPRM